MGGPTSGVPQLEKGEAMTYSNGFAAHARNGRVASGRAAVTRMDYSRAAYAPTARRGGPHRRPARRKGRRGLRSVAAVAAAAAFVLAAWLACSSIASISGGSPAPAATGEPQSTPKSEWHAGEVPKLYQRDPAWASARYGNDDFAESGCGPTCMAMVYVALTGRDDMLPTDMGALSERMGCVSKDGTAWTFMTEGAAQVGLTAEELPADEMSVRQALLSGSFVICSMGPGDFTTTGHFIVLVGIDQDGRLIVRDPNSPERTGRAWDFDAVLGQSLNLWAYTAAR